MSERALATAQKQSTALAAPARGAILQRKCACGNHTMAGGECAECKKSSHGSQGKLTIGASNDPLEHEADRVADMVAAGVIHSSTGHVLSRAQRSAGSSVGGGAIAPPSVEQALASPGVSLQADVREDMEQKFGYDFSKVRVHTGSAAEQSARDVRAEAYTVGHHIAFGAGRYAPTSRRSQKLIAHELAHVVQQSSPGTPLVRQDAQTMAQLNEVATSPSVQRQGPTEIEAPNLEAVSDPGGVKLPAASADPRSNSDFIDRRLNAVGVGLSGVDFILFCDGIPDPIAVPFNYIDLGNEKSEPVDQIIYPGRDEALNHLPFGPPQPGGASQFAFYRAVGGLVIPTRFSATSAPETVKLINAAKEKLKQFKKQVTDTLIMSVLLYAAVTLAKMGISRWILPRVGAPRKLPIEESLPAPKRAAPAGTTSPGAPAPETPTTPKVPPEGATPPKAASPAAGEQLKLFPELTDAAPSRPLVPQPSGASAPTGRAPRMDVGEVKSVESEAAGWRQINGRKYTHKIPDSGHEAVATYSADGTVRLKVRISGGDERVIFDEVVGQVPKGQLPSAKYGTKEFGDAIEDPIRAVLENSTGQKFFIKNPSAKGPDVLPPQTSLPVEH
jgi:hypothetical protein